MNPTTWDALPKRLRKPALDGGEVARVLNIKAFSLHQLVKRQTLVPKNGGHRDDVSSMLFDTNTVLAYMKNAPEVPVTAVSALPPAARGIDPHFEPAKPASPPPAEFINQEEALRLLSRSGTWFGFRLREGVISPVGDLSDTGGKLYRRADVLALKELDASGGKFGATAPLRLATPVPAAVVAVALPPAPVLAMAPKPDPAAAAQTFSQALAALLAPLRILADAEHIAEVRLVRQPTGKWSVQTTRTVVTTTTEDL